VDGVSLEIVSGEVVGLVGESGSGKTTLAHALTRLVPISGGRILHRGIDITNLRGGELRRIRRRVQMIFQDPYESLDPRQTVEQVLLEPLTIHHLGGDDAERRRMVLSALESVGLTPASEFRRRYPHQLSGGQRQRVSIAAAMILEPELLVADEPVSMLDVSVRAGILGLMLELRRRRGLAFLYNTHDLSLAWVVADRIAVMYLGRVVEVGPADAVIRHPRHPYTRALVSVIPVPDPTSARLERVLPGETPSPSDIPAGCRFHPRCPLWLQLGNPDECVRSEPTLGGVAGGGSLAACHFMEEVPDGRERA
jgi:oligopeptide/dipeptide ABC transporter ATP-binding protein